MDKKITLEGVELNISLAIRRVKKDIENDWFKDPFMYKDYLDEDFVIEKINSLDLNNYSEERKESFDIPKQGFVIRHSIETQIIDRVLYQALVDIFAKDLDKALNVQVYSHRVASSTDRRKYFFKHPVEQWRAFNNDAKLALENNGSHTLLVTDLTNFYENIDISVLNQKLKEVIDEIDIENEQKKYYKKVCDLLKVLLDVWAEQKTGCGIPQNRDPSSFLANMYLHKIDEYLINLGYSYFRYMDDLRFVCENKYIARKLLKNLISELRKIGLNVNSRKTQILESDDPNLGDWLPETDRDIEQIDSLFRSRNLLTIKTAIPLLKAKTIELINDGKTGNRHFRFCIERYIKLLRVEQIKDSVDISEITPIIIRELLEQPWATDVFFRFLECVELTQAHCKEIANIISLEVYSTYEWQSYYLWQLLIAKKYKSDKLLEMARSIIKDDTSYKPQKAGSCLYLSSLGSNEDQQYIAKNFVLFKDFFTQRIALIAVKDLVYKDYIEPYVKEHVLPEYVGTFRSLKDTYPLVFYIEPEAIHYNELYNELPEIIS